MMVVWGEKYFVAICGILLQMATWHTGSIFICTSLNAFADLKLYLREKRLDTIHKTMLVHMFAWECVWP